MDEWNKNIDNTEELSGAEETRIPREPVFPPQKDEVSSAQNTPKADSPAEYIPNRETQTSAEMPQMPSPQDSVPPEEPAVPQKDEAFSAQNAPKADAPAGYIPNREAQTSAEMPQRPYPRDSVPPNMNHRQMPMYPQPPYAPGGYGQNPPPGQEASRGFGSGMPGNPGVYPQQNMYYGSVPYGYGTNAPQEPMKKKNTGVKVFLIALCSLLGVFLIGFVAFIAVSLTSGAAEEYSNYYGNNILPTSVYSPTQAETQSGYHAESDYSDETDPDYKGLTLQQAPKDKNNSKYTPEYAYNTASPSVVGVVCYADTVTDVSESTTQGSGIILTADGYVATNAHIVNNSKTSYAVQVVTSDGKTYDAGVVGVDSRTDIAVLKLDDAENLTPAVFSDSEQVAIGSDVIAIGNPGGLGYQNSITKGIVSAVNRTVKSNTEVKYIQTDAAINPGNSGGPLCNLYGQVIGMNSSKIVSERVEGMGFSIPSTTIKSITDALIQQGFVSGRVKLGVTGTAVTAAQRAQYGVPAGILVDSIEPGGPLDGSKLEPQDIITEIDGETVSSFTDVYTILQKHKVGDEVTLTVYRYTEDETFDVKAKLAVMEE